MQLTDNVNQIAVFGEVLFDSFPDGSQILGCAPFNVAWHLQAFYAQPLFISRVGNIERWKSSMLWVPAMPSVAC